MKILEKMQIFEERLFLYMEAIGEVRSTPSKKIFQELSQNSA